MMHGPGLVCDGGTMHRTIMWLELCPYCNADSAPGFVVVVLCPASCISVIDIRILNLDYAVCCVH